MADDMNTQDHKGNVGAMIGVGVAGVLLGALAGVLMAPKSGEETRADIAELAGKMKDDIMDKMSSAAEVTAETYRNAVDAVVNKYHEAKEITEDEAGKLKEQLYSKTEEAIAKDRAND